ncbi:DUF624 domain-containing protein [Microbacterium sp. STN6]|uniref:DUF624 domain-containing protein n=1 Tax=Microbacterium sp. STN6 TaxID=2995588 RepID=UPI002260883A|nr:DUF624 domain-containing protein [Microbacterium sp. STN6]MCX7520890.1 DUF624 domain-containing protein [Microbacterium sp. STN6]
MPARRRRLFAVRQETFESIFGHVYTALMINVSLIAANLPLAIMVFAVPDPLASWPFFMLLSLTLAPSLAAAFGAFKAARDDAAPHPLGAFWRSYRRNAGRAFVVGLGVAVIVSAMLFNLALFGANTYAPLFAPTLVMIAAAAVAVAVTALAGFAMYERVSAAAIVKAAVYLAVRRWYFSVMALVLLGLIAAAVLVQPVLGAFLVPSVLLFAVWSNAHFAFTKVVEQAG